MSHVACREPSHETFDRIDRIIAIPSVPALAESNVTRMNQHMHSTLKLMAALFSILAVALVAATAHADEPGKPNVVYILSDDVGWGDLSVHGGEVPTPNIDSLASEGVKFTDAWGE